MLAKPQGFPRKLGGCAGLDPRLRSAVSAGVGDGERGLRRGLRAPGVGVRPKWVLEYSPSNKRIRYFVSITYVRTGLWTAHKFCGGGHVFSSTFRVDDCARGLYTVFIINEIIVCLVSDAKPGTTCQKFVCLDNHRVLSCVLRGSATPDGGPYEQNDAQNILDCPFNPDYHACGGVFRTDC